MKTGNNRPELEAAAEEIFELTTMSWLARSQRPRQKGEIDLTESEFLTLDWLAKADPEPMNVGDIQRRIHVLPAQMSRVLRALETKAGKPLIRCRINPTDKRKVDVTLAEAGKRAHRAFRDARLAATIDMVAQLSPADQQEFMRILQQFRSIIGNRLSEKALQKDG
ncbi:MAG: MarR family transcriptional regulator [Phycisphaerae bacterium]|nr:MarR family transcriptional regulator [Phycisphaerae bacterium]